MELFLNPTTEWEFSHYVYVTSLNAINITVGGGHICDLNITGVSGI